MGIDTVKLQKPAEGLLANGQAEEIWNMQASFSFISSFILTCHTLLVSTIIKVHGCLTHLLDID
jgi:hypothetical protein